MEDTTAEASATTVLVTGGSGFVGSWVIAKLLGRGHRVRTTVRRLSRENDVRAMLAPLVSPEAQARLSFHEADLLRDAGWKAAVTGADHVLHVASPMRTGEYRGQDVVTPAREGTRRVLEASLAGGVRRVVITSSAAAAVPKDKEALADETVWTEVPEGPLHDYPRAKTLAERDAWRLVQGSGDRMELVTVLPTLIQGPVLGADYSASVDLPGLMLRGRMPLAPRLGYSVVDVRDLADLHVLAMTRPEAAGQRFLAAGEFLWISDMAQTLRDALGPAAARTPRRTAPDWAVRLGARFNAELAQLAPGLGVRSNVSARKAETLLGWRTRPARDSLVDAARSLMDKKLV
ncbi:NAD-dependent epimerase/dehydratase family protein [Sphaerisporangium sp. TRM90804]|uniref:NAD-dependent epimerase/dehydratase family protein n=1 Tax=Sphaerisporangium sp. TRM90804 TaxID=3031113 RepID=UPI002448F60F|nr:NAD-dependent epimerase/dehydratase family protein [Sphaerisporangium sp. TRM90804]MDH2425910.1 NAD-dependent epimerase/dehydratase family protein [Sphaerisporangium sp. TRM90804]